MATSKLAIVTGVSLPQGIGRSIVHKFLSSGFKVGGIDHTDVVDSDDLQSDINGNRFAFAKADISSTESVETAIRNILTALSSEHIHVLVNNAAISDPTLTATTASERVASWRRCIDVNLTGAFIVSEICLPYMINDSSVIHISSTRARQSEPNCEAYAASKAGLCGLTHAMATSLSSQRVRVNCVLPGWIDTGGYPISDADNMWHSVGRVGLPKDVAELCSFLAESERSGFITGQEFVVDGGVSTKMVYPDGDT
mmetsp:Transcript_26641/g.39575  ORF Transcript_26641/g.39575 Transcript_26641/m.39575 type:complete len:255 (-) Transcript_26641:63-827(-)